METSTLERDESRPPLMTITDELRVGEQRRRRRRRRRWYGWYGRGGDGGYGGVAACITPDLTSTLP